MYPPAEASAPETEQQPPKDEQLAESNPGDDNSDLNKKIEKELKDRARTSKDRRKDYASEWKRNIESRSGQASVANAGGMMSGSSYVGTIEDSDSLRSEINPDWSLTKMKTANLFSQVPQVQATHENSQFAAAVPPFMKALNYELGEKRTNIAVPMEEILNDVVNASGIGAIYVDYQARFRMKKVPAIDPKMLPPGVPPSLIPMTDVPEVADYRFGATRISPRYLLWPSEFIGSNFDDGDWVGYSGRIAWSDAKNDWLDEQGQPLLDDEDEKELTGESEGVSGEEDLRMSPAKDEKLSVKRVRFDHIFYWRHRFDPDEPCFSCIWEIIFVQGRDEPVLHRAWKGQRKDEQTGRYIGAQKFPVRILTLTYITDNPVPPSDSSAGRPQVNDLRLSRSQLMQNRARSIPIRGFNVNMVDPLIADNLMRGVVQGMIPFQGSAQNAIWEVARSSYPKEDFEFDAITKQDLLEVWQFGGGSGASAQSASHRQTKAEAQSNVQQFQTRIGQERNRVAAHFLSVCEVLAGLMCLYSDFPNLNPQEKQTMQQAWDQKRILHDLVLKIRPDSQVVLDVSQRIDRLFKALNMVGKSGFVNPGPIIAEILELSGLDPSEVMIKPQPKPPEEPTLSFRFTGEDMKNPFAAALLMQLGKAPSSAMLEEAKQRLIEAQMPPKPPTSGAPPAGAPPMGPGGQPGPQGQQPPVSKVPAAPDVVFEHPKQAPSPIPGTAGQPGAHPDWAITDKVAKRSKDIGGGL